ncbi:MAG TPA: T9SS type A sorting domain-containing protein [Ferruginibacter sp.]|nr:T9SS type A sorting domain-containing protein [Ferruginibacter sp.]HMP20368.1 T9SS type A sorting domain-containing protein [Ferruginibacter sp.]
MKAYLQISLLLLLTGAARGQSLTVGPGSKLVLKGNVSLVIRNSALINNGEILEGNSTVHFTGQKDSSTAYLGGNSNTMLYNLTINKSSMGAVLKASTTVRHVLGVYNGNLYADSNLILKSDSLLTARVDAVPAGANIHGKAIVERYFPNRRAWRLVTSPLTATTSIFESWQNKGIYTPGLHTSITGPNPTGPGGNGLDPSPLNNASMKKWNTATQALENIVNTKQPLSPGNNGSADNTGYFLFVRGDRDYNNFYLPNSNNTTLRSNGKLQVGTQTFTAAATAGGYTLIGNPFASPVDFNKINRTNLVKRFYIWDPLLNELGAYVMLDDLDNDGVFTKSILASSQTQHIQSSQAFFVETLSNGSAGISFAENSKSDGNNNKLFRPGAGSGTHNSTQSLRIVLHLDNGGANSIPADGVLLEYNDQYSKGIDRDDALKYANINETLAILKDNYPLTAERSPMPTENDTIFLRLQRTSKRAYLLEFNPSGITDITLTAWLEDNYLKTSVPVSLTQNSSIPFLVDGNSASAAVNRFRVVFKKLVVLPDNNIAISAVQQQQQVHINWMMPDETGITKYTVEKSTDGIHFTTLTTLLATGLEQYLAKDAMLQAGFVFYRVLYTTVSGEIKYSNVVKIKMDDAAMGKISVYPNPVQNNIVQVQLKQYPAGRYQFRLMSTDGRVLYEYSTAHQGGSAALTLKPAITLAAGNYLLEISNSNNSPSTIVQVMVK